MSPKCKLCTADGAAATQKAGDTLSLSATVLAKEQGERLCCRLAKELLELVCHTSNVNLSPNLPCLYNFLCP